MTSVLLHAVSVVRISDVRPDATSWLCVAPAHNIDEPLPFDVPLPSSPPGPRQPSELTGTAPAPVDPHEAYLDAFVPRLLTGMLDVIQRRRPAAQLVRWVSDDVLADLILRARLHQRDPQLLELRTYRRQREVAGVVEVSARFRTGPRDAAAALRLECTGDRWLCQIADFGPLGPAVEAPLPQLRSGPRDQVAFP